MAKNFKRPVIVGALMTKGERMSPALKKELQGKKSVEYLPLRIKPKDLMNTIECMKLVDVHGLTVSKKLEKEIFDCVKKRDRSASDTRRIDTIVREKGSFTGYDAGRIAIQNGQKKHLICATLLTSRLKL